MTAPEAILSIGSETCPRDGAALDPRLRQHITPAVRYHVRRCSSCAEEYLVAQPGPSGTETTYVQDALQHPDGEESLSEGVLVVAPGLLVQVLSLHRLDVRLLAEDAASVDDLARLQGADESVWNVHADRVLYGYLWTLGAYEVVRTLCELGKTTLRPTALATLRDARDQIARVRVPLAKSRSKSRRSHPDEWFAFPTLVPGEGIGWRLGRTTISRKILSAGYRAALRAMRDDLRAQGHIRRR